MLAPLRVMPHSPVTNAKQLCVKSGSGECYWMSGTTSDPRFANTRLAPRKPLTLSWSDPRVRSVVSQVLIIGAIVAVVWYLAHNTAHNLDARHIATGFGFLAQSASIPIGESLLDFTPSVSSYGRALLIGLLNTL